MPVFPNVPTGQKQEGHPFPGNELPGYFQMSLRDNIIAGYLFP
jgi:hypothetical protein